MKLIIVNPLSKQTVRGGNHVTAVRWARIIKELGHRVRVIDAYRGEACDVMIALHAKRSARSISQFHRDHPNKPLLVALTGTDLHRDIHRFRSAQRSLEYATRLILLEPEGIRQLPAKFRSKSTVITQSASPMTPRPKPLRNIFEICVSGHLRYVKDPLRAAMAVRKLPADSRVHVTHIGAALAESWRDRAVREMQNNDRYTWLGRRSHRQAMQHLARARLLVLTSRMEGAPSVFSEALANDVPIIATRISASCGILGSDYPGLFNVGDTLQLRKMILRAEGEPAFLQRLARACERRKPLIEPALESERWRLVLAGV